MAGTTNYTRELPVKYDVDVLVVGGGPAGCAAAWAAAGTGANVLLIEAMGALGGMGTLGAVPAFMQFGDGETFLAGTFAAELLHRLETAGGICPEKFPADSQRTIGIRAEVLKRIYDEMMTDAGVSLSLCTQMIDVQADGRTVRHAICAAKSGVFAITAKTFVDCTGDGDLCAWAGAEFEKGDEHGQLMPGTLCSLWANIDYEKLTAGGITHQDVLAQAIDDGVFSVPDRHLSGIWPQWPDEGVGGGNVSHAFGVDGTDEVSLTRHFIASRKLLTEYERFYNQYMPGHENARIVNTGALLGIRETRRIVCDYRMTLADFQARACFEDEIGRYCYPVDIHMSQPDEKLFKQFEKDFRENYRYAQGESYGIPYRSLVPADLDNVLVAGRCIGSDRYIQGSLRVMPGCYLTGRAAGLGAGLAVGNRCTTRAAGPAVLSRLAC